MHLYRYKSMPSSRRAVSVEDLMAAQEVSHTTLKCDIAKLGDQLHVHIGGFNRKICGYQLEPDQSASELPSLWFSHEEILSLVTSSICLNNWSRYF